VDIYPSYGRTKLCKTYIPWTSIRRPSNLFYTYNGRPDIQKWTFDEHPHTVWVGLSVLNRRRAYLTTYPFRSPRASVLALRQEYSISSSYHEYTCNLRTAVTLAYTN